MSTPSLSFIIITRDRREELDRCLANIHRQVGPSREVIVVDNGSSDGTNEMVRRQYEGVHLVVSRSNLGVAGGRNRGVLEAQGAICVFLDDDAEFADPRAGQQILDLFESDPTLAVIAFTVRNDRSDTEEYTSIPRADKRIVEGDYICSYFCGCGFAARRQVLKQAGLFWEPLVYAGEELDLSYRLLELGYRLLHSRAIQIRHRSVATARPRGQYIYFNARNRVLIALRNLPWLFVASTAILWWLRLGYLGLRTGQLLSWLAGMRDAFSGMPMTFRTRRCIGWRSLQVLRATSGRYWY